MPTPKIIPNHHSPVRRVIAEAHGAQYEAFRNLEEARAANGAYLIMEGDWGGQIYLVCPVRLVEASEKTLGQLLAELDQIAWSGNAGEGAGIYYEQRQPGAGIAGGMGGGLATDSLWIHPEFLARGLGDHIRSMITGKDG